MRGAFALASEAPLRGPAARGAFGASVTGAVSQDGGAVDVLAGGSAVSVRITAVHLASGPGEAMNSVLVDIIRDTCELQGLVWHDGSNGINREKVAEIQRIVY